VRSPGCSSALTASPGTATPSSATSPRSCRPEPGNRQIERPPAFRKRIADVVLQIFQSLRGGQTRAARRSLHVGQRGSRPDRGIGEGSLIFFHYSVGHSPGVAQHMPRRSGSIWRGTGAVSSAGERFPDTEEVTGSNPVRPTITFTISAVSLGLARDTLRDSPRVACLVTDCGPVSVPAERGDLRVAHHALDRVAVPAQQLHRVGDHRQHGVPRAARASRRDERQGPAPARQSRPVPDGPR
jgi:hypothetical protein